MGSTVSEAPSDSLILGFSEDPNGLHWEAERMTRSLACWMTEGHEGGYRRMQRTNRMAGNQSRKRYIVTGSVREQQLLKSKDVQREIIPAPKRATSLPLMSW
ncbi:uncharacterized protein LOC144583992 [Pogona vitticeps]